MPLPIAGVVEAAIFELLAARRVEATICPSEVARALQPGASDAWHHLMPRVRRVAALLAARGRLRITQRGVPVDTCHVRGPIRLGRASEPAAAKRRRR